jgi:CRP/FNR family transcriptional regulator, cyclic AMP receptor protein
MTYEKEMLEKMSRNNNLEDRLDISLLKYLWDAGPLSFLIKEGYYDFFNTIPVLSSFTSNEVRLFTKFLHRREFQMNELVFNQGDAGYGFYFIYSGSVNIFINNNPQNGELGELVTHLEKSQYFGEMGLLEKFNRRTASAVAAENTILLGIFKPDLEQMLERYPVLGAKFLKETALIMASRMGHLTREVVSLRKKIKELENKHE